MKLRKISRVGLALLTVASLSTGCALFGSDDEDMAGDGGSGTNGGFSQGDDSMGGGGGLAGSEIGGERVAELETVYFDYDRAAIRSDQTPTLRTNAGAIANRSDWRTIVVEGYCDERGSEEYNLALGERRANSVRQYLVDSGVQSGRVDTVSFGESKPAVQGHDESAWKWNRRAEFRVIR